jgi:acyl-coenzyme A thioesterase PaaI-like protein
MATDVQATKPQMALPQMDWLTLTDTTGAGPTLRAWIRVHKSSFGRWLFARTVAKRAPYFGTIRPRFHDLQPKLCRVWMKKRRAVENHIGTVHALAMGNLCELAAGMCTEVTIPVGMRWIPRGMTIEYLAKAETDVTATARLEKTEWAQAENVAVPVSVHDANGKEVVRAVISMYVSPKKES